MLKLLVKKQLTEIFRAYLYDAKKNRARSKAATVGYLVFFVIIMVGIIGGMFTALSLAMCRSMAEAGMSWFYFAIMGLMAILLGAFGSVFTTYSSLYLPKDNDQMLSLPIPVNTLIAARLLGVYLMGLMYSGVVVLPAIIVYWVTVSAAPLHLLAGVLFLLLISLFVMAIFLPAGLGGGQGQPEAEEQKLRHRGAVAGVLRPVLLFLLLQSQLPANGATTEHRPLRR